MTKITRKISKEEEIGQKQDEEHKIKTNRTKMSKRVMKG